MNESIHMELPTCVVRDLLLQRAAQVPERPFALFEDGRQWSCVLSTSMISSWHRFRSVS